MRPYEIGIFQEELFDLPDFIPLDLAPQQGDDDRTDPKYDPE